MKTPGLLKRISAFLARPYPFYYKGRVLVSFGVFLFVASLAFLYVFEPFIVYLPEHKMPYFWISAIHSLTPVAVMTLLSLLPFNLDVEEKWTVKKELLLIVIFLVLVGSIQFLIRDLLYDNAENWSWRYLYEEIRNTLLIGGLFAVLFTSLNHNRLNLRNIKKAAELNAAPHQRPKLSPSLIEIPTSVKSDAFALNVNALVFARAVGNYVEIFLWEDALQKVLKRTTLKELMAALAPFPNILKTHRSYLVNLDHIKSVKGNAQGYKLYLQHTVEQVPVARMHIATFNARYHTA